MRKTGWRLGLGLVLLAWSGWLFIADTSSGTMQMQKKAKELGFAATDCTFCHGEKMPKKGAATYNDRGKWLQAEKDKRGAKEVDVAWLKEYPADKK
jgi:cytochrome c553